MNINEIVRIAEESAMLKRWLYKFLDDEAYLEDAKDCTDDPETITLNGFDFDDETNTFSCYVSWFDEGSETGEMSDTFLIKAQELEKFIEDNDE